MRRHDIDNLRWMSILLLFPYHTFTLFNTWGEAYYVRMAPSRLLSLFVKICQPWFMPLLFVLAGVSTVYALRGRTPRQYLKERVRKLLVPLLAGLILVVPSLTYFAERFHNGYTGGYFAQYRRFFTMTDLVGYHGGFTPAHLWFLAYLFVISVLALPLVLYWQRRGAGKPWRGPVWPWFAAVWLCSYVLNISGKSVGRYFALFVLGAVCIAREEVQASLERRRWALLALCAAATALLLGTGIGGAPHAALFELAGWSGVLTLLGFARRRLSFESPAAAYFTAASFPIYIFHLPWIVAVAYALLPFGLPRAASAALILTASFGLTLASYELARRVPPLRALFAIKRR